MTTNQGFKSLTLDRGDDPDFYYHLLQLIRGELVRRASGTTFLEISGSEFSRISVPRPAVAEQRRVAEILDAVDDAIHSTERLIAKLRTHRHALVEELLHRSTPRSGSVSLAKVASIGGGVALSERRLVANPVSLPYLRVANVQDGHVDTAAMKTATINADDLPRYRLQPGDVLMNEGGDFDKLGRGAVWDGRIEPCLHQNHVFRVRCDRRRLLPEYLALYTGSTAGKKFFLISSKQSTNLASINRAQLSAMPLQLPSVETQARVVEGVARVDRRLSTETSAHDSLVQLRVGLADDLLTGRVRTAPA